MSPVTQLPAFRRRMTDNEGADIEHHARALAKQDTPEGKYLAREFKRIDELRRNGHIVRITEFGKLHNQQFHYIRWTNETTSLVEACRPTIPDAAFLAWGAFFTGLLIGASIGLSTGVTLVR